MIFARRGVSNIKRLLYHVAESNVPVLYPWNYACKVICLSEDEFLCCLGEWLYIFDFDDLHRNFPVQRIENAGGLTVSRQTRACEYRYASPPLPVEYRIHQPIVVAEHAIAVARNFAADRGEIVRRVGQYVVSKEALPKEVLPENPETCLAPPMPFRLRFPASE